MKKRIGIMSAMLEEIEWIGQSFVDAGNLFIESIGDRDYLHGILHEFEIVAVFSRWGKVASAATAATLINYFEVDCIIFTGVAGSVCDNLNLGDIVIADKLYQHDMDARPIYDRFEIPLTKRKYFETNPKLREQLLFASDEYISSSFANDFDQQLRGKFSITCPKVMIGTIASGDQFISSSEQIQNVKSGIPDVLCVEMEGAAVAQVCHEHQLPFAVIRVISDSANHTAQFDFQEFIQEAASFYSKGVFEKFLKDFT